MNMVKTTEGSDGSCSAKLSIIVYWPVAIYYHSISEPKVCLAWLHIELCRASKLFAAHLNQKSAFWSFIEIFGLELKTNYHSLWYLLHVIWPAELEIPLT